jgi:hypothetical protein
VTLFSNSDGIERTAFKSPPVESSAVVNLTTVRPVFERTTASDGQTIRL